MSIDALLALYNALQENGILVFEYSQKDSKAVTIRNAFGYGIFLDIGHMETAAEELSVLAHEYGHCATGATHALSSPLDLIDQHEYKADKWAAHYLIPPDKLRQAVEEGYTEPWELAERLNVTEDFLRRTVYIYQCEGLIE